MKHARTALILLVVSSVVLWGCATIMHGSSQKIGISSTPSGAKVTVDGKDNGVTPAFASLKRGDEHVVKIELEGYEKAELTITKTSSGWVWGNIIFGGLIGLVVDIADGAIYNLTPEQLNAELRKQGTSAIEKEGTIYLVSVLKPQQGWTKIATLEKAP
jgi:uncharacterized protein YceK